MTESCHQGLASETADRWAKASPPSSAAQQRKRRIRRMRVLSSRQAKCIKSERWVRVCRWLERPGFGGVVEDGNYGEGVAIVIDRKSTRLNSSHLGISYAVF